MLIVPATGDFLPPLFTTFGPVRTRLTLGRCAVGGGGIYVALLHTPVVVYVAPHRARLTRNNNTYSNPFQVVP